MRLLPIDKCLDCNNSSSVPGIGWYCEKEKKVIIDVNSIPNFCFLEEVEYE